MRAREGARLSDELHNDLPLVLLHGPRGVEECLKSRDIGAKFALHPIHLHHATGAEVAPARKK